MNQPQELTALRWLVNEQNELLTQYAGMRNFVRRVMECDDYLDFRGLQLEAAYFLKDHIRSVSNERKAAKNEIRFS